MDIACPPRPNGKKRHEVARVATGSLGQTPIRSLTTTPTTTATPALRYLTISAQPGDVTPRSHATPVQLALSPRMDMVFMTWLATWQSGAGIGLTIFGTATQQQADSTRAAHRHHRME